MHLWGLTSVRTERLSRGLGVLQRTNMTLLACHRKIDLPRMLGGLILLSGELVDGIVEQQCINLGPFRRLLPISILEVMKVRI